MVKESFILTFIAGMSTLMGVLPIFVKKDNYQKIITFSLAFTSGIMITLSIFELIPSGINYLNGYSLLISLLMIVFGNISIYFLSILFDKISSDNLYTTGILSVVGIVLHNVPEGIITYMISSTNIKLGIAICLAIILHNIPEGISIAIPIYYSTKSKFKAFKMTFIAGISELFGAILSYLFLAKYINNLILGLMLIFTAGIMLGIAFLKLLPTCYATDKRNTNYALLIGIIFMLVSLLIDSLVF